MDAAANVQRFVLDFLAEIGAQVAEEDGVFRVQFPPGYKRRFGRERLLTFQSEKRREHVETVEAGSPFLKALVAEAKNWGGLGAVATPELPDGSLVYTFRFESYSSLKKRTQFVWATLEPGVEAPRIQPGLPPFARAPSQGNPPPPKVRHLQEGLARVLPLVEQHAQAFAEDAVRESRAGFQKAMTQVAQYFQTIRHDTHLDEARIRKRLGEIQSKLYFTEDGLRELKLQREAERLTQDLHALKKRNMEASVTIDTDKEKHIDQQRRRHEPKLRVRLVAATLVRAPAPGSATPSGNGL